MTQKLVNLKRNLTIISITNILLFQNLNKLTAENFAVRLAQADLITKTDFDTKLSSLNRKIMSDKTKHLLVKNELKKLKTFYSICYCGKRYLEDRGTHNYLVF